MTAKRAKYTARGVDNLFARAAQQTHNINTTDICPRRPLNFSLFVCP
jgi:hypothetical protein